MRLFEVEVNKAVPTPEGEIEAENKVNVIRDNEGDFYAQVRADLDAPYRDFNTSYFDQSRVSLDLESGEVSDYFNDFEFPNDSSANMPEDAVTFRYLPGRSDGFEKKFNPSKARRLDYVPFLNDLFTLDDQRVFGRQIYQQVQDEVEKEDVSREDFMDWITQVEPEMYEMLLDNFREIPGSEQFFCRDVVDEKQLEKKSFVEYIVRETLHQQKENYDQTGPNNISAEEVFAELPDYRQLAEKIPHIGQETQFEMEFKDPFGRSLMDYIKDRENREEAQSLQEVSSTGGTGSARRTESDGGHNLLHESGLASVEGVLTLEPEEVTDFLGGEV